MNDQLTIWGGSTATGLPVTNPVRKAKRTSQGGVVIPLFRKAAPANPRNRDAPSAVEECEAVSSTPGADAPSPGPAAATQRSTSDPAARTPRAAG